MTLNNLRIRHQQTQVLHQPSYHEEHQVWWGHDGMQSGPQQSEQAHQAGQQRHGGLFQFAQTASGWRVQFQVADGGRYAGTQYPHW